MDCTAQWRLAFFIRSGWKPIKIEKGEAAIAVLSLDNLPSVIDTRFGSAL